MSRADIFKEEVKNNIRKHFYTQLIIMLCLFTPVGIGSYIFLVNHDYFYGKPEYFVPLVAVVLLYISLIRKLSKFLTWICWNEVVR